MESTANQIPEIGDNVKILVNSKFAELGEVGKIKDIKLWGTTHKYMINGRLGCFWLNRESIELLPTKQTFYGGGKSRSFD